MERTTPRILVTLDGSALDAAALPVAARLATALGAEATLLRVLPPAAATAAVPADDLPPLVDLAERAADEALRTHEASFPGLRVTRVVLVGTDPAQEIIDWLRSNPVDFVVMATHGHGGVRHLLGGSVTEAVLRSGLAPVVAVRPVAVSTLAAA